MQKEDRFRGTLTTYDCSYNCYLKTPVRRPCRVQDVRKYATGDKTHSDELSRTARHPPGAYTRTNENETRKVPGRFQNQ